MTKKSKLMSEVKGEKCYCLDNKKNNVSPVNRVHIDEIFENRINLKLQLILHHHVFNEQEAAFYCRTNVESIRYHALRSRKLSFCDFSKGGLVFLKTDLDNFLTESRKKSYRD